MSIDIDATCREAPKPDAIARVADLFLRASFTGGTDGLSWRATAPCSWLYSLGERSLAELDAHPPGPDGLADEWWLAASPTERSDDAGLVVAIVLIATAVLIYDGRIEDSSGFLARHWHERANHEAPSATNALLRLFGGRAREAGELLAALRVS
jgi:hypothetical protein